MAGHGLFYRVGRSQAAVRFALCAAVVALWTGAACSQQEPKESFGEAAIGNTLKVLAKTYVTAMDLKKFKKRHSERIQKMDEQGFRQAYANTLGVLKHSPKLQSEFGLSEEMGKAEALQRLQKIDKKTLCAMVDAVPDKVLIAKFKAFSSRHSGELTGKDTLTQVHTGWKSFTDRLEK